MKKTIGFICAILLFLRLDAQQTTIDSLLQLLKMAKKDTTRINLLNLVAAGYRLSQPDSIMTYANKAHAMSINIHYVEGEVDALRYQTNAYVLAGNYSKALEIALEALKKSETLGDKILIARCLNGVAYVYADQGDIQQAHTYSIKIKEIYEQAVPRSKNCTSWKFLKNALLIGLLNKVENTGRRISLLITAALLPFDTF